MRAWRTGEIAGVSITDLKRNARIDDDMEDRLLQGFLDAAHERAEQETGIIFGTGEWIIDAETDGRILTLPIWPVNSLTTITADGVGLDLTGYALADAGRTARLTADNWPARVLITVNAGMQMPATVRQAILLMASHWVWQRETASEKAMQEVPYGASLLLGLNRRMFA